MGKGRAPCCDKSKVRTGPWSTAEDLRLTNFIQKNGHTNWRALPKQAGLLRCGKSCRLRWVNYLSPDVKRGNFSPQEEQTIIDMHNSIGNKWSKIASRLPGRTDNEIKNVWNTHLKKRVVMMTMMDDMKKNIQGKPYSENIIHMAASLSASSPCSSSNSTTSTGDHHDHDQNMEELPVVSGVQDDRVKKPDEKPESLHELISTSDRNHDDKRELVEIPSDIDDDLWELLNSLDPLQFNKTAEININEEKLFDGEIAAVSEWLRILENNEDKDRINGVSSTATNSICHEMNSDYSSTWP